MVHRIIDSIYGEVMLKPAFDCVTNQDFCDVYIGDNFDEYVGEIDCSIDADIETIENEIDELF